ncbi:MAG: hypothetical protein RTS72_03515 [Candidatus Thorarchaeota archaeon]
MDQVYNRRVLIVIRFALCLPLVMAIGLTILNWSYVQTQIERIWPLYTISIVAIVTLFLIPRARVPESFSSYQHAEHYVKDAREHRDAFTIPVVCPICKTPLKLDEVKWQDQHTLMCQECHSKVDVTIT